MPVERPRFSIVAAVYGVEPYLADFITSIEHQTFDGGRIEVIAVDDGSTDGSLAILEEWRRRRPELVTVLSQANAGQAAARNLGLEHATGEWVTFTDPDDVLDPEFFAVADRFASEHPEVDTMASKTLILDEFHGRVRDRHPRRAQYAAGNRTVDLDREPGTFSATSSRNFYRLDRVRRAGLTFDPRIRPTFEDGHFAARFVLDLDRPLVAVLRDARYLYRKRRALNSTMQQAWANPGRYGATLELGFLDLIERAKASHGSVPPWLQHLLIYELSYYFAENTRMNSRAHVPDELADRFHDLFGRIVRDLDPAIILRFATQPYVRAYDDLLIHGFRDEDWHTTTVRRTRVDDAMGLQRLEYRYRGPQPRESFRQAGRAVEPAWSKTVSVPFFGRTLLWERLLWLPEGAGVTVELDGALARIEAVGAEAGDVPAPRRGRGWRARLRPRARLRAASLAASRTAVRLAARLGPIGGRYAGAWVLMDRIHDAGDNGQRLFEHLRTTRADINAWFVVEAGTPDWKRMRSAHGNRVLAYGSFRWKVLMLRCRWLVTSHIDVPIVRPPALARLTDGSTWRFAFLQHGVIESDLSGWLNTKQIDLIVTSTEPELESIASDGTPYRLTGREARLTGLPRFDRLVAQGRGIPMDQRDLVIVAPTWRSWLTLPTKSGATQRREINEIYWGSEYERAWSRLIASPEIAEAAARRGLTLGFMPHPNIQPVLDDMPLPAHVEALRFAGNDVQALYARCSLLVTDYSTVAFDLACLERPVIYYQFDWDQVVLGGHLGRRGYFDFERDGFGPVTLTHDAAVAAIVAGIEAGPRPAPVYLERIERTLATRDGRACERVVAAIEELSRPYRGPSSARPDTRPREP